MTEENTQQTADSNEQGAADRMVKEASYRFQDIPKGDDLKGFQFEKLFQGRLDKENYIYALVGSILVGIILSFIPVVGFLLSIPLAVIGFGVMARRFHDINQTGWFALVGFVPVVNLIAMIYLAIADAIDEGNQYGAKPDSKRRFYHAILNI